MKVFTHNFNPRSNSGPNKFTRDLFVKLLNEKGFSLTSQEDADVEFCLIQQTSQKKKPMILRLDGIYFNSAQDYDTQNAPIKASYENSDVVIFQSNFNKALTEHWFGKHPNSHVIHNAYFDDLVKDETFQNQMEGREIWSCASTWRPHKRLVDNVRYFIKEAPESAIFIIAGAGYTEEEKLKIQSMASESNIGDKKIAMLGNVDYNTLRQLYDASSTFVHLAYLDHCPNVVVDAYAHGCKIVCSDSGGTQEIGNGFKVICEKVDTPWDFSPIELYNPPEIDFERSSFSSGANNSKEMAEKCLNKYEEIFRSLL